MKLQLVGGGRVGEALLGGLLSSGWGAACEVAVVEKVAERRDVLAAQFPDVAVLTKPEQADGVVVAVKPGDVEAVCAEIAAAGCERALSIAAGVTIARLEAALGPDIA